MLKPKKLLLSLSLSIFLLLTFFGICHAEEKLTITTYYPSPYGSYYDLYVANKLGIGTTDPGTYNLNVAGNVKAKNLNALVVSASSYTWSGLSAVGNGACPSGYHVCVALEALVRCYMDSTNCRTLGGNLWVSGNHDTGSCSRTLMSHSGSDCWGGEGTTVGDVAHTNAGYHWIVHSPGSYAGSAGPSLGAELDTVSNKVACCPNY